MVNTVESAIVANARSQVGSESELASANLADDFNNFLTLLTTQLQNQDPLSPMETNEFTNQLVSFAGVEQQIETNANLETLSNLQAASILNSGISYVGMDIEYFGDVFEYSDQPKIFSYEFGDNALSNTINVINEDTGSVVRTYEGETQAGLYSLEFDGLNDDGQQLPPGNYAVQVVALNEKGESIDSRVSVTDRVRGVEVVEGTQFLIVGKDQRRLPINQAIAIREPNIGS